MRRQSPTNSQQALSKLLVCVLLLSFCGHVTSQEYTLNGYVRDVITEEAVSGAKVIFGPVTAITSSSGNFKVSAPRIAPEEMVISIAHSDYLTATRTLEEVPSTKELELTLLSLRFRKCLVKDSGDILIGNFQEIGVKPPFETLVSESFRRYFVRNFFRKLDPAEFGRRYEPDFHTCEEPTPTPLRIRRGLATQVGADGVINGFVAESTRRGYIQVQSTFLDVYHSFPEGIPSDKVTVALPAKGNEFINRSSEIAILESIGRGIYLRFRDCRALNALVREVSVRFSYRLLGLSDLIKACDQDSLKLVRRER